MKTKRTDLTEAVPRREIDVFDEMDRMFDTLFHRGWLRPFRDVWPRWARFNETFDLGTPRLDVIDRDDEILVRAEVPGVDKKNLKIDLTGQHLRIQGERRREEKKEEEEGKLVRSEIARGSFSRTVRLSDDLDFDKAKADFKDGILEVHLPKTHKTERRQIAVD
jgi:HSP20 family protein